MENMARPKAVREAAKQAEELARQQVEGMQQASARDLSEYMEDGSDEPGETQNGPGTTPPDTDSQAAPDTRDNGSQTPAETARLNEELRIANERYHALRNKYDAEVPRLARERKELLDRIENLESKVQEAQEAPPVTDQELKAERDKLLDEFPEDAVDAFSSLTEKLIKARMPAPQTVDTSEYETDLAALREEISKLRNESAVTQLETLVPDWKEINDRPSFKDYLKQREPLSGREYNDLMNEAFQTGDIARTAQFFNRFKEQQGQERQQNEGPLNGSPDIQPEGQGRGVGDAKRQASQPGKKIWGLSEITEINQRAARGEFRGREKELSKLREQIEKAASERRIDQDA